MLLIIILIKLKMETNKTYYSCCWEEECWCGSHEIDWQSINWKLYSDPNPEQPWVLSWLIVIVTLVVIVMMIVCALTKEPITQTTHVTEQTKAST